MSELPSLLREKAAQYKQLAEGAALIKQASLEELKKAGVDPHVAEGLTDESLPSYEDMWSVIMKDPKRPFMDDALAHYQLLDKAAARIEELEFETSPAKGYVEKLAGMGIEKSVSRHIPEEVLEKLASLEQGSTPREPGSAAGMMKPKSDPILDFIYS